jgi:serine/threonine protein kinase
MDDTYSERSDRAGVQLTLDDHTAGVGTRLYASPEQMNGSDYDCSTDVSIRSFGFDVNECIKLMMGIFVLCTRYIP